MDCVRVEIRTATIVAAVYACQPTHRDDFSKLLSEGAGNQSDRRVVGQANPLPDCGSHYLVRFYTFADRGLPKSYIVLQLQEGHGFESVVNIEWSAVNGGTAGR